MKPILEIQNISKLFTIQQGLSQPYLSLRDKIMFGLTSRSRKKSESFWALKDVDFNVMPGETIGIIGKNGAGKSTLLKILSKITPPTKGKIICRGRLASLLEVGTGFHPELTGRENIFLNGAILGMRKLEIQKNFDAIVDFAGVEKFIDTPLKHYSSGMQLRLAFAVAAFLENEILIIDEVLAVGDLKFQRKCIGKMEDISRNQGRTVLFVSHNFQALSTITRRSVILESGEKVFDGSTSDALMRYTRSESLKGSDYLSEKKVRPSVVKASVKTSLDGGVHENGKQIEFTFDIFTPIPIISGAFSFQVVDHHNVPICHFWVFSNENGMLESPGLVSLRCVIPEFKLYMGQYSVVTYLSETASGKQFEKLEQICPFEIVMYGKVREHEWMPETCKYIENFTWTIL